MRSTLTGINMRYLAILLLLPAGILLSMGCSSGSSNETTPVDEAKVIVEHAADSQWLKIRDHVTSEFKTFDEDVFVEAIQFSIPPTPNIPDWTKITQLGKSIVVHDANAPFYGLVFVKEAGEWRFNPGPDVLTIANRITDPAAFESSSLETMLSRSNSSPDLARVLQERPLYVNLEPNRLTYATELSISTEEQVTIDLAGFTWGSNGTQTPGSVTWVNGQVDGNTLRYPAVDTTSSQQITIRLVIELDQSVEQDQEVSITFGEIKIGDETTGTLVRSFNAVDYRILGE